MLKIKSAFSLGLILFSLNSLSAQFSHRQTITSCTDCYPREIYSADLDNDSDNDVIVAYGDGDLAWFANLGVGQFSPKKLIPNSLGAATYITVADLDNDLFPDILATFLTPGQIAWYRNNQDGTFSESVIISEAIESPYFIKSADFDGDNDMDLYASAYGNDGIFIFTNNGTGQFTNHIIDIIGGHYRFYHADMDSDGDIDIVGQPGKSVFIWENDSSGNFPEKHLIISNPTNPNALRSSMDIGDIDGDGDPDILGSYSGDGDRLVWYENLGNFEFSDYHTISNEVNSGDPVYAVDLDLDGDLDAISDSNIKTGPDDEEYTTWHENYGKGEFGPLHILTDSDFEPSTIFPTDLDGDGDPEMLTVSRDNRIVFYQENYFNSGYISGFIYVDENENGIWEAGERKLEGKLTSIAPQPLSASYKDSTFTYMVRKGSHTLKIDPGTCWELTSDTNQVVIPIDTGGVINISFGVKPVSGKADVKGRLSSSPTRCGFTVPFSLISINEGCEKAVAGKVALILHPLVTLKSSNVEPSGIIGDTVFWNFDELAHKDKYQLHLMFQIAGVDFLGDTIHMPVFNYILNESGDYIIADTFFYTSIINCAVDPNDKIVHPGGGQYNNALREKELVYTVRFQNTGTDTAFTVEIRDVLDLNLNVETLRMLESSHAYEYDYHYYNNTLEIVFPNILLPDSSTNVQASNGFVSYGILPKTGVPEKKIIRNTADILFDFNPPVTTNTVRSKIVSAFNCVDSIGPNGEDIIPLDLNISIDDYSCPPIIDGSIFLHPTGGLGPFTYSDSVFADSLAIQYTTGGYHIISIEDAGNCAITKEFEISTPEELSLSALSNNESYLNAHDGWIQVYGIFGGTSPYEFHWSNGDSTTLITGLAPGIYMLSVTDANSCLSEYSFEVGTTVGIGNLTDIKSIAVHPNPVKGTAIAEIHSLSSRSANYKIMNAIGQVTFHAVQNLVSGLNKVVLPEEAFPIAGYYLFLIETDGKTWYTGLIKP